MPKSDPSYLKPLLLVLAVGAGVMFYYASVHPEHYKIHLRSLCLLVAVAPAAMLSLTGTRAMWLLRLSVAAALMLYIFKSGKIDTEAMKSCFSAWPWLLAGVLLIFLQAPVGALRWKWLLEVQGIKLGFSESLRLTLVGFFFNICLPGATGGDLFKAFAISRRDGQTARAITAVLIDRVTGLGGLVLLAALALALNLEFIRQTPSVEKLAQGMLIILIVGGVLACILMSKRVAARLRKSFVAKLEFPGRDSLASTYRAVQAYHQTKSVIGWAMGVSLVSHLCTVSAAVCFANALSFAGLSFAQQLLLVPLGLAFNSIPLTPGGVGQGQTAFYYLYSHALPTLESAGGLGAAMMTLIHVSSFLLGFVGAGVYALGYHNLHEAYVEAEGGAEESAPLPQPSAE